MMGPAEARGLGTVTRGSQLHRSQETRIFLSVGERAWQVPSAL